MRKLTGNTDIEDSLDKLDKLTQEEARMASAEMLKMTRSIDDKVQDIGSDVKDLGSDIKDVSSEVRGVDNKLDQANRPLSLYLLLIVLRAQTASQGISSEIVFSGGSRLQIHQ